MSLFRRRSEDSDRWIVFGLGNPGAKYEVTRHNAGAMVLDRLLEADGARLKSHRSGCLIADANLGGTRVVLARPATYMNTSGRPARALLDFYKLPASRVIVVHDELDVPFGEVRVKSGGGTAGHNGLKSLASHLGTKDFIRVRVGIGRPRGEATSHVLQPFSGAERKELPKIIGRAAEAVEWIVESGADRAMNEFNTRERG